MRNFDVNILDYLAGMFDIHKAGARIYGSLFLQIVQIYF